MNLDSALAWVALVLWAALLCAVQGALGHTGLLGQSRFDLSLVLCLSLATRVNSSDFDGVWLACALGRCAVSSDPPLAVMAGFALVLVPVRILRPVVDLGAPLARCLLALVCCAALESWLEAVHIARAMDQAGIAKFPIAHAWQARAQWLTSGWLLRALASGFAALLIGPWLARLPGLRNLHRRKLWGAAVSWR